MYHGARNSDASASDEPPGGLAARAETATPSPSQCASVRGAKVQSNGFCPTCIPYLGPAFGRPFRTGSETQRRNSTKNQRCASCKPPLCYPAPAVAPGGDPGRAHTCVPLTWDGQTLPYPPKPAIAARAQHPTLARAHQKPNSAHPNTWHPNWCALPQGSPRVSLRACVRRATQSIKYA